MIGPRARNTSTSRLITFSSELVGLFSLGLGLDIEDAAHTVVFGRIHHWKMADADSSFRPDFGRPISQNGKRSNDSKQTMTDLVFTVPSLPIERDCDWNRPL